MKTSQIIAVVGLVASIGFGVVPLQNLASEESARNEKLFAKKQKQIEEVEKLEKLVASGSHEKYIPDGPEEIALADDLNNIAKKTGITLPASWSFNTNTNSQVGASQISVSFPIEGRRQQIANFLKEIEQNQRFLGVKDFSMKTDFESSLSLTSMDVDVYGFFLGNK